jgi:hypothetical protein
VDKKSSGVCSQQAQILLIPFKSLFNRKTIATNGQFAIKTVGHNGDGDGRYVLVSGSPVTHPRFSPQLSSAHNFAYLKLAESVSEFKDGVCFLCLPTDEVQLSCLDKCFVVSPKGKQSLLRNTSHTFNNVQEFCVTYHIELNLLNSFFKGHH